MMIVVNIVERREIFCFISNLNNKITSLPYKIDPFGDDIFATKCFNVYKLINIKLPLLK